MVDSLNASTLPQPDENAMFYGLSKIDLISLALFIIAWFGYSYVVDVIGKNRVTLTASLAKYRGEWMREMAGRDVRIVDTQINSSLQTATAFFASTSLFAIGGSLTLLGAADKVFAVFSDLPVTIPTKDIFEVKVFGLVIMFVYAFFKFAWGYRLFNYCAILIGATPQLKRDEKPNDEMLRYADIAAKLNAEAGQQYNKGQRAFFFALGYLGWFVHPYFFLFTTLCVVIVLSHRQFASKAVKILSGDQ
jgi:uncharacterized membrane protein